MGALETARGICGPALAGRAPGSDAERRTAARMVQETGGALETFWCRPSWAVANAWHLALGIAGALLSVSHAKLGGALVLAALVSLAADGLTGRSPGRRLSPEHASQNVFVAARERDPRVRLILTANLDTGRAGLARSPVLRRAGAAARRRLGPTALGWAGWVALDLGVLVGCALARAQGSRGDLLTAVQLACTVALVLVLAFLVELSIAPVSPGAGGNASGAAVATAVYRALSVTPPAWLAPELLLTGAGEAPNAGLRDHLRRRRLRAPDAVVIGFGPAGTGTPHWWTSDGPLLPVRTFAGLRALAGATAAAAPDLGARPHAGRGSAPSLPAMLAGIPAITLGALDPGSGIAPNAGTAHDTPDRLDPSALGALTTFALMLVDAIDQDVAGRARVRPA